MTPRRDPLELAAHTDAGRDRYRFRTSPGAHSADEFRRGDLLACDALWDRDPGRLLVVEAGYGVVGTVLADAADAVTMATANARDARLCERNAADNDVTARVVLRAGLRPLDGGYDGEFDAAVTVPEPYTPLAVARERMAAALETLAPGGNLFVAARPDTGLARFREFLERTGADVTDLEEAGDWTLLCARRPDSGTAAPEIELRRWTATVDGTTVRPVSVPGLFSPASIDDGTRLLAETARFADGERVLDVCCGYGLLGAVAALTADCEVWCSDVDRVATACAERTLDRSGVDGTVVTGEGVDAVKDRTFDHVVCNPPTHAPRPVLADLFGGIASVLAGGGRLSLVHHRDLDLDRVLDPFARVERVATGPEHVILEATDP